MNRLVRAELYRVQHSNHFFLWLVMVCFIFVVMMSVAAENVFSLSLGEVIGSFGDVCIFMMVFIAVFSAVMIGIGYMRKTAYYEVMAGNRISHILFSKMIVDAILVAVCSFIATIIVPMVIYMQNGLGTATQVIERFALYFVVLLHVCVCSVLIATSIRHIIATIAVYIRFSAFDIIALIILAYTVDGMSVVPTWYEGVRNCFVMNQMSHIFVGELSKEFVIAVFGSFLIETAFWYIVSYNGMKKKLYG